MAALFKPLIVEYLLPDGASRTAQGRRVTKTTPGAVRNERRSKKWYGRYTDRAGGLYRVPLSESKETARRMLAKLAGDAQLAGVGLGDAFAEHRAQPLAEHLDDYCRHLAGKGDTAEHVRRARAKISAIADRCGWQFLDDMHEAAVTEFLNGLAGGGRPLLPLEPGREWFTRDEVAAAVMIHPESVRRMLSREGFEALGEPRPVVTRVPPSNICKSESAEELGPRPATTT